jgi:hypothetical protein
VNAGQIPIKSGAARSDFETRIAPRDWTCDLAAFESGLADRLRALPSDAARQGVLALLASTLHRAESRPEA